MEVNGQLLAPTTSPLEDQHPTVCRAQVYHNQNKVYTFPQNNEIIRQ
jgi:hypothetical protein